MSEEKKPSDAFISLDTEHSATSRSAAERDGVPGTASKTRVVAAALAAAASLVLVVVCLGFVHPSPEGGWSVAWLFQTTEHSAEQVPAGSGESAGGVDDPNAVPSTEDVASDAANTNTPASQTTSDADTSASNAAGDDTASQGGGAQGGSSSAAKPGAAQGGSSASGSGGGDGAGQQQQTVTVSVSIDSSSVGSPVSASSTYTFERGATAYDALCALGVSVNAGNTGFGVYVSAIGGLAEKEHGATSGWLYTVNGTQPATAASNYELSDGDVVRWVYSVSE